MSQNIPWGAKDVVCGVPSCGNILGEAKTPEEARRVTRICEPCSKKAWIKLKEYATAQIKVEGLSNVRTMLYWMFMGKFIVHLFAQNYGRLMDVEGFERWWATNVYPASAGELTVKEFISRVRAEYVALQRVKQIQERPVDAGAQVAQATEDRATLPGLSESDMSTPEEAAPPMTEKERRALQEKSAKSQGSKKPGKKTGRAKAASPADTPAEQVDNATEDNPKEVESKVGGTPKLEIGGGDADE